MVVKEVSQESCRHFRPFGPAAAGDLRHRRIQTVRRQLAVLLNHALDPVAFGAVGQRTLQLLRIDARRIFAQQWNHVVRGNHVFHDVLVFQQSHPGGYALLLGQPFVRIFRGSRSHQRPRVFGYVHPRVERFRAHFFAVERAQINRNDFPDAAIAIGIAVPFAQHDVMLGAQVVIPAVLGKQQPVQEQRIGEIASSAGLFAEQ
jgi:hypothetical protein